MRASQEARWKANIKETEQRRKRYEDLTKKREEDALIKAKEALEARRTERQRMDDLMRKPAQQPLPPKRTILRKGAKKAATNAAPEATTAAAHRGDAAGSPERRQEMERQRREWREGLKDYINRQRAAGRQVEIEESDGPVLSWQELKVAAEAGFEELLQRQQEQQQQASGASTPQGTSGRRVTPTRSPQARRRDGACSPQRVFQAAAPGGPAQWDAPMADSAASTHATSTPGTQPTKWAIRAPPPALTQQQQQQQGGSPASAGDVMLQHVNPRQQNQDVNKPASTTNSVMLGEMSSDCLGKPEQSAGKVSVPLVRTSWPAPSSPPQLLFQEQQQQLVQPQEQPSPVAQSSAVAVNAAAADSNTPSLKPVSSFLSSRGSSINRSQHSASLVGDSAASFDFGVYSSVRKLSAEPSCESSIVALEPAASTPHQVSPSTLQQTNADLTGTSSSAVTGNELHSQQHQAQHQAPPPPPPPQQQQQQQQQEKEGSAGAAVPSLDALLAEVANLSRLRQAVKAEFVALGHGEALAHVGVLSSSFDKAQQQHFQPQQQQQQRPPQPKPAVASLEQLIDAALAGHLLPYASNSNSSVSAAGAQTSSWTPKQPQPILSSVAAEQPTADATSAQTAQAPNARADAVDESSAGCAQPGSLAVSSAKPCYEPGAEAAKPKDQHKWWLDVSTANQAAAPHASTAAAAQQQASPLQGVPACTPAAMPQPQSTSMTTGMLPQLLQDQQQQPLQQAQHGSNAATAMSASFSFGVDASILLDAESPQATIVAPVLAAPAASSLLGAVGQSHATIASSSSSSVHHATQQGARNSQPTITLDNPLFLSGSMGESLRPGLVKAMSVSGHQEAGPTTSATQIGRRALATTTPVHQPSPALPSSATAVTQQQQAQQQQQQQAQQQPPPPSSLTSQTMSGMAQGDVAPVQQAAAASLLQWHIKPLTNHVTAPRANHAAATRPASVATPMIVSGAANSAASSASAPTVPVPSQPLVEPRAQLQPAMAAAPKAAPGIVLAPWAPAPMPFPVMPPMDFMSAAVVAHAPAQVAAAIAGMPYQRPTGLFTAPAASGHRASVQKTAAAPATATTESSISSDHVAAVSKWLTKSPLSAKETAVKPPAKPSQQPGAAGPSHSLSINSQPSISPAADTPTAAAADATAERPMVKAGSYMAAALQAKERAEKDRAAKAAAEEAAKSAKEAALRRAQQWQKEQQKAAAVSASAAKPPVAIGSYSKPPAGVAAAGSTGTSPGPSPGVNSPRRPMSPFSASLLAACTAQQEQQRQQQQQEEQRRQGTPPASCASTAATPVIRPRKRSAGATATTSILAAVTSPTPVHVAFGRKMSSPKSRPTSSQQLATPTGVVSGAVSPSAVTTGWATSTPGSCIRSAPSSRIPSAPATPAPAQQQQQQQQQGRRPQQAQGAGATQAVANDDLAHLERWTEGYNWQAPITSSSVSDGNIAAAAAFTKATEAQQSQVEASHQPAARAGTHGCATSSHAASGPTSGQPAVTKVQPRDPCTAPSSSGRPPLHPPPSNTQRLATAPTNATRQAAAAAVIAAAEAAAAHAKLQNSRPQPLNIPPGSVVVSARSTPAAQLPATAVARRRSAAKPSATATPLNGALNDLLGMPGAQPLQQGHWVGRLLDEHGRPTRISTEEDKLMASLERLDHKMALKAAAHTHTGTKERQTATGQLAGRPAQAQASKQPAGGGVSAHPAGASERGVPEPSQSQQRGGRAAAVGPLGDSLQQERLQVSIEALDERLAALQKSVAERSPRIQGRNAASNTAVTPASKPPTAPTKHATATPNRAKAQREHMAEQRQQAAAKAASSTRAPTAESAASNRRASDATTPPSSHQLPPNQQMAGSARGQDSVAPAQMHQWLGPVPLMPPVPMHMQGNMEYAWGSSQQMQQHQQMLAFQQWMQMQGQQMAMAGWQQGQTPVRPAMTNNWMGTPSPQQQQHPQHGMPPVNSYAAASHQGYPGMPWAAGTPLLQQPQYHQQPIYPLPPQSAVPGSYNMQPAAQAGWYGAPTPMQVPPHSAPAQQPMGSPLLPLAHYQQTVMRNRSSSGGVMDASFGPAAQHDQRQGMVPHAAGAMLQLPPLPGSSGGGVRSQALTASGKLAGQLSAPATSNGTAHKQLGAASNGPAGQTKQGRSDVWPSRGAADAIGGAGGKSSKGTAVREEGVIRAYNMDVLLS